MKNSRFPPPQALGAAASEGRSDFSSDDPENRRLIQRDAWWGWIMVSGQGESMAGGRQALWHRDGELVVNPSRHCPTVLLIWWL